MGIELPKEVQKNIRFLKSKKVWYILSKNVKVVSCPDAAANRNRLGAKGIPIFDELKTELGYFINKDKKKQKVLIHCRGNQKINRLKVSSILNAKYQRLESEEQIKGLINPFGKQFRNLLQIFDDSTIKRFHSPYTMMTNAGHFEYAFEFEPHDLVKNLKSALVKDIIRKDNYKSYKKHKIGILTGNGPDSGILLWKKINNSVKNQLKNKLGYAFRGDLSYPEITIESIPEMGMSMELKERLKVTENTVIKSVLNLCKNGASLICIACNTTQFFQAQIEDTCSLYNVEFISMADVLESYLIDNQIKAFDFIGISYVADFKKYSGFKKLAQKFLISIPEKNVLDKIEKIAFEAKKDPGNNKTAQPLGNILRERTEQEIVIIALTEISTVLDYHKKLLKSKKAVDTLQIMADHIACKYIDNIYNTLYVDEYKDNIIYEKLGEKVSSIIKSQIWKILLEIDYEFIPPLSYRDSTTFSFDSDTKDTLVPEVYYKSLLQQDIMISIRKEDNAVVGFMSYINNHDIIHENFKMNCVYITTIGVTKGVRGNGIARQFYKKIEDEIRSNYDSDKIIATRTWSTNKSNIKILESIGYIKAIEIKDDRGSGIHTVYYTKKIES